MTSNPLVSFTNIACVFISSNLSTKSRLRWKLGTYIELHLGGWKGTTNFTVAALDVKSEPIIQPRVERGGVTLKTKGSSHIFENYFYSNISFTPIFVMIHISPIPRTWEEFLLPILTEPWLHSWSGMKFFWGITW